MTNSTFLLFNRSFQIFLFVLESVLIVCVFLGIFLSYFSCVICWCDIMVFNEKYIFDFHPWSWHRTPETLGIS